MTPDPSPALLSVEGLRKHFRLRGLLPWTSGPGAVHAVDDISFDLRAGETLSIVGESGCGKTTTARLILRLEDPDAGVITFKGKDVSKLRGGALRKHRSSVQAVFQDPWNSLNPRMRARGIIGEPLTVNAGLRGKALRTRVTELMEMVGLDPASIDNFPHEFSGGQRQRLAVARAISLMPDLVVLDEPVSALDVSIRAQIMNLLKDLQEELNLSYIIIAHDLATVRYLSHRVAVMYLGEIVELATTEAVFSRSKHPYTRALISAATSVDTEAETGTEIILSGELPSAADPPPGCRFHTRCWLYESLGRPERCRTDAPKLRGQGRDDQAACHFSEKIDDHLAEASVAT